MAVSALLLALALSTGGIDLEPPDCFWHGHPVSCNILTRNWEDAFATPEAADTVSPPLKKAVDVTTGEVLTIADDVQWNGTLTTADIVAMDVQVRDWSPFVRLGYAGPIRIRLADGQCAVMEQFSITSVPTAAQRAAPDGHTLMLCTVREHPR